MKQCCATCENYDPETGWCDCPVPFWVEDDQELVDFLGVVNPEQGAPCRTWELKE